jgi:hypothetical protein
VSAFYISNCSCCVHKSASAGTDWDAETESTNGDSDTASYTGNDVDYDNFPSNVVSAAEYEAQLRQAESLLDEYLIDPEFDDLMSVPENVRELGALESTFETSHLQLMMVVEDASRVVNQLSTMYASLLRDCHDGRMTATHLETWVECNNGKYYQVPHLMFQQITFSLV